ncbi:uncharacterized protein [Palaemon carinicauda]|uniref:uncharacterized protein n=1 Tax=Palaemon carinicauda TaxID=392227 RepID=UPI0035B69F26
MTSSSSPRHGRDPGLKLIRISPARIQTQVTQTVRYRPVRSLILLGLLVVISLFVLFTLSQMAVVQHTMMAQLETGRPGAGGGGWAGVNQGGRASRPAQKPWRSQFNQFKIEPLLIRNAPSVEVNTAMAANRRRANQIAAIIVRSSLLANQFPNLSHTDTFTHPDIGHSKEDLILTRQLHAAHSGPPIHDPHSSTQPQTHKPHLTRNVSSTHQPHKETLVREQANEVITSVTSRSRVPSSEGITTPEPTIPFGTTDGKSSVKDSDADDVIKNNNTQENRELVVTKHNNNSESSEKKGVKAEKPKNPADTKAVDTLGSDKSRRQFFQRLECTGSSGSQCDTKMLPVAQGEKSRKRVKQKPNNSEEKPHKTGDVNHNDNIKILDDQTHNNEIANDPHNPKESQMLLKGTAVADDAENSSKLGDPIEKDSEHLPTEFSEAEKDFEPLYLREDEDYDLSEEKTTNPPTSEPQMPTRKVPSEEQLRKLPTCPDIPPQLKGHLNISLDSLEQLRLNDVLKQLEWVMPGGTWSPSYEPTNPCLPRHKVAVVLPYRDRLHHLIILLSWLHPILRRQQLEYTIYVAEQAGNATFNKGSIMNAGFMEAWQRSNANCFVFHDVDLLPEDDRNMYSCPPQPRHLSVGVDTLGYKLPYFLLVGGVLSVRGDHFLRLNGYSNMYWGWGGEDDDMGYRIKQSGLSITRPPNMLARYTMIRHLKRRPLTWKVRGKLVRTSGRRYRLDGLNTLKYSLLALHKHPLFTHLLLDVGTPPENLVRLDSH